MRCGDPTCLAMSCAELAQGGSTTSCTLSPPCLVPKAMPCLLSRNSSAEACIRRQTPSARPQPSAVIEAPWVANSGHGASITQRFGKGRHRAAATGASTTAASARGQRARRAHRVVELWDELLDVHGVVQHALPRAVTNGRLNGAPCVSTPLTAAGKMANTAPQYGGRLTHSATEWKSRSGLSKRPDCSRSM
jgi:hypothetical protein